VATSATSVFELMSTDIYRESIALLASAQD